VVDAAVVGRDIVGVEEDALLYCGYVSRASLVRKELYTHIF
jgi:hypothetical protein